MAKTYAENHAGNVGEDVCSPFFDKFGSLHVVSSDSGNISVVRDDISVIHSTNGQPSAAVFDENGLLYITDYAHGAVLAVQQGDARNSHDFRNDQQDVVVAVYEDKLLKGPSSIAFDKSGNIFFTDSGNFQLIRCIMSHNFSIMDDTQFPSNRTIRGVRPSFAFGKPFRYNIRCIRPDIEADCP